VSIPQVKNTPGMWNRAEGLDLYRPLPVVLGFVPDDRQWLGIEWRQL